MDFLVVDILKQGWLHKRGEHIKTWRPRYFVLKSNGNFLGYNNKPTNNENPNNTFFVKNCKIIISDKPKLNAFILKCSSNEKESIERVFATSDPKEREEWIKSIQSVSNILSGNFFVDKSKKDNEKITLHDFEFLKVLGKGTFGKVVLCRERFTKRLCAMKILKKNVIIAKNEIVHTETENKVMRSIKHPFITSLIYSFQTTDRLCLVMEYVNGGELLFHLSREKKFSEYKSKFYCAEICYAIGFLHSNWILHRDIKLENILLDSDGHIKLTDFGLCKTNMSFESKTKTFCGTLEYLAPEIVSKESNDEASSGYTRAVDWWAVGVVLYEMLVGRLPFSSKCDKSDLEGNKVLFEKILNDEVRFPLDLSNDSKLILWQLLEKKPSKRLGSSANDFNEIKNHSFFSSIEWQKLIEKRLEPPFRPLVNSDSDTCYFEQEFTGENVQLTPPDKEISPISNNYFDSFSFYGSKCSLNSQNSNSTCYSNQSKSDGNKSDKFDTTSLTRSTNFVHLNSNEIMTSKFSYLSNGLNVNSFKEDNSSTTWKVLANCAFPNIIPKMIFEQKTDSFSSASSISDSEFRICEKMDL